MNYQIAVNMFAKMFAKIPEIKKNKLNPILNPNSL